MMKAPSLLTVAAATLVSACGGGDSIVQVVVVDETRTLAEGAQLSYPLALGTYRAEITSSRNGVAVVWVGGTGCQSATETKSYSASCVVDSVGALGLLNPTLLGVPGDEVVSIKVTRL
jgi:hypothetical protein